MKHVGTRGNAKDVVSQEQLAGGSAPPVDAISIAYTTGRVTAVTEDGVTTTVTYNTNGTVNTVSYPRGSKTRTETYSYTNGALTGMAATEA